MFEYTFDRLSIYREVVNLIWLAVIKMKRTIPTHDLIQMHNRAPSAT